MISRYVAGSYIQVGLLDFPSECQWFQHILQTRFGTNTKHLHVLLQVLSASEREELLAASVTSRMCASAGEDLLA